MIFRYHFSRDDFGVVCLDEHPTPGATSEQSSMIHCEGGFKFQVIHQEIIIDSRLVSFRGIGLHHPFLSDLSGI